MVTGQRGTHPLLIGQKKRERSRVKVERPADERGASAPDLEAQKSSAKTGRGAEPDCRCNLVAGAVKARGPVVATWGATGPPPVPDSAPTDVPRASEALVTEETR